MQTGIPAILAFAAAIAVFVSLFAGLDTMAHGGDAAHNHASARWMGWRVGLQLLAIGFIGAAIVAHVVATYL